MNQNSFDYEKSIFFMNAAKNAGNDIEFNFVWKMFEASLQYESIFLSDKQRAWLEKIAGSPYIWDTK